MLLLNNVAELIVSNDLIQLAVRQFNQEFILLVIGSIIVLDLSCNGSSELATVRHITNESKTE